MPPYGGSAKVDPVVGIIDGGTGHAHFFNDILHGTVLELGHFEDHVGLRADAAADFLEEEAEGGGFPCFVFATGQGFEAVFDGFIGVRIQVLHTCIDVVGMGLDAVDHLPVDQLLDVIPEPALLGIVMKLFLSAHEGDDDI
jgi:hypothetical protein